MDIYNSNGTLLLSVVVDDNSYRSRQIMGDESVTLYYSLPQHVEIPVGAYIDFQNARYFLERPESFKMRHSRLFEYTVLFEAYLSRAKRWIFRNPIDGRLSFPLTATPREHLEMFVANMNRRDSGWTVGSCIEGAERLVSYDHAYCIDALKQMADEFNTEYEVEGKTVSLRRVEYDKNLPLPLSYGKGNGFKPNVGRSNSGDSQAIGVLYVQGGERNIDPSTYGNKTLLLPKSQFIKYDGTCFEDEDGYNSDAARTYAVSADGLSVVATATSDSLQAEGSLDCSEIYPKRVCTVGQVVTKPNGRIIVIDANLASDPCPNYEDYLIEGETMTIIFQTGTLAGREFEVKFRYEGIYEQGFLCPARSFEIIPQDYDGVEMPQPPYSPKSGDKFVAYHCSLPSDYIRRDLSKSGASWDMFRAAVRYLFDNEGQKFTFTGELDGIWASKNWEEIGVKIRLGGYISFTDDRFQKSPALVRITGVKDYINSPYSPEITLSNETVSAGFGSAIKTLKSEQEVVSDANYRQNLQFTKRRFRDAQETTDMLSAALLSNFSQAISPVAVQSMQLLIGDETLQFRFVSSHSATNPTIITPEFNYSALSGMIAISINGAFVQHLSLGIDTIKASHSPSEYLWWTVSSYRSGTLEPTKAYYVYLEVPKTSGGAAQWKLSSTAFSKTAFPNSYILLVGIVSSDFEGNRSFSPTYGYTAITGGRIVTDMIVSNDGLTYFDLPNGVIGGRIKFLSTDGNERLVSALETDIADAADAADAAQEELNSWASDGSISPTEKDALLNLRPNIVADYSDIVNRCTKYSVSYVDFSTVYSAAITAIDKYSAATPAVIAKGEDYDDIAAYWTARTAIIQTLNEAVKSYGDDALTNAVSDVTEAFQTGDESTLVSAEERIQAFGETIIDGGYIKTDLINTQALIVQKILAGVLGGQRVEITPDNKSVEIYDSNGNLVSVFEGNSYTALSQLFSNSSGSITIKSRTMSEYGYGVGVSLGKGIFPTVTATTDNNTVSSNKSVNISSPLYTASPTEITIGAGNVFLEATAGVQGASQGGIAPISNARAVISLYVDTYSSNTLGVRLERMTVASATVRADYETTGTTRMTVSENWNNKKVTVRGGYHVLCLEYAAAANGKDSTASAQWGNVTLFGSCTFTSQFYVSRYFANGFCLGVRDDNYVMVQRQANGGMKFICETGDYGMSVSSEGIKYKLGGGTWSNLPMFVAKFKVQCTTSSAAVSENKSWNGYTPSATRTATGDVKITFPSTWSYLALSLTNTLVYITGFKSSSILTKGTLVELDSTHMRVILSDDASANDSTTAYISIFKI